MTHSDWKMLRAEEIATPRLDLIATTPAIVQCELDCGGDSRPLAELVGAEIPSQWPPEHWEPHVLEFVLRQMAEHPHAAGWTRLVALREHADGRRGKKRILIGTVGAIPPGTAMAHAASGEIEVGYGILPAYRRRGYATEALAALCAWVERQVEVRAFVAQTLPHLEASIGVLKKSGFQFSGPGFEDGAILFRRECETIVAAEKP
jgi:RimJ/RimL family protein N-acetyltransferase